MNTELADYNQDVVDTARLVLLCMQDQGTDGSLGTFVTWMKAEVPGLATRDCLRLHRIASA